MATSLGLHMTPIPQVLQGIEVRIGDQEHGATGAAIATGRPASWNELLAPERHAAVAAGTSCNLDKGFVDEDQAGSLSI